MRNFISSFLFLALLLTPVLGQGGTLEPSVSVGLISDGHTVNSSMRLTLDYNHIIDLPRLGDSQLVLSGGVFVDVQNALGQFVEGEPLDFNGVGATLNLAWQHPLRYEVGPGLSVDAFSLGASLETLIDAEGQRHLNLNLEPALRWNMRVAGQNVTIFSKLQMGFGLDQALERDFNQNDFNRLRRR